MSMYEPDDFLSERVSLTVERRDLVNLLKRCSNMLREYHLGDDSSRGQSAADLEERVRATLRLLNGGSVIK